MKRLRTGPIAIAASLLLIFASAAPAPPAAAAAGSRLFIPSAIEHPDDTVTLPLHRGLSNGRTVYYIVLDASSAEWADRLGVNRAQKLANAGDTAAVQHAGMIEGVFHFPATVDFTPERHVVPGPQGFPPEAAQPGAVGEPGYSPLIQLPDGTVLNAPHVRNASGQADKVVAIDLTAMTVRYQETGGFQGGKAVKYVSTDASDPGVAALENVTFAPALNAAPAAGDDSTASARASLAAFVNGQTGAGNPERQGLNSALLDGLDPLNILRWAPNQGRYSPLWDVNPAAWTAAAMAAGDNPRQTDWGDVENLVNNGAATGPGGAAFGPAGFVVNCPIVSQSDSAKVVLSP